MSPSRDTREQGAEGAPAPDSPQARALQLVALANTLCDEGRAVEAEDMARWVLSQSPNMPGAQTALARARLEQGHAHEARTILEGVVAKHPAFFSAHRWLAEVLVRLGDWPRASEVLLRAEVLSPGQPRIAALVQQVMGSAPSPQPPPLQPGSSAPARATGRHTTYEGPGVPSELPPPSPQPPALGPPRTTGRQPTYDGPAVPSTVNPRGAGVREPSPPAPRVAGRTTGGRAVEPSPAAPPLGPRHSSGRLPSSDGPPYDPAAPVNPRATGSHSVGRSDLSPSAPPLADPPARPRRPTYEGPAVAPHVGQFSLPSPSAPPLQPEPVTPPAPIVRVTPPLGVHAAGGTAALPATGSLSGLPPLPGTAALPQTRGNTPTRRQAYPAPAPGDRRRRFFRRLRAIFAVDALTAWARRHPWVALVGAGLALFAAAAFLGTWFLRLSAPRPSVVTGPAPFEPSAVPALRTGALTELTAIVAADARQRVRVPDAAVSRALLAEALLATEYDRPARPELIPWVDELVSKVPGRVPDELAAAQVLLRLAHGDRAGAAATARSLGLASAAAPVLRFAEGRLLQREGDGGAAGARLGDVTSGSFVPGKLLAAELMLDRGDADGALELVHGVLQDSPEHPGAVRLLIEARHALGTPFVGAELKQIEASCAEAAGRVPSLEGICRLHTALDLRRTGNRRAALKAALTVAQVAPADPRLLALDAQLLANIGATADAAALVAQASDFADPRLPPLAWARAAVALATDRRAPLPGGPPPSEEARLIASRSAFVGVRRIPGSVLPASSPLLKTDGDLRWMSDGARARGKRGARKLTRSVRIHYGTRPPGPVAAFVAGTLARRAGERPLAQAWLSQSLDGHGDACRAATLYRLSLRDAGKNPLLNAKLQRAIGHLNCDRK